MLRPAKVALLLAFRRCRASAGPVRDLSVGALPCRRACYGGIEGPRAQRPVCGYRSGRGGRGAPVPLQVDVGAGDAVVPAPEVLDYPGLLDLPRARLRAYRPETSIAEKTEAMVRLAQANSRMKDFFDIHRLAETRTFDGETMRLAVAATFTRRGIEIPGERPLALTSEFADDTQKKIQWAAFVRRARRPELADLPQSSRRWIVFSGPCFTPPLGANHFRVYGRTAARGESRR